MNEEKTLELGEYPYTYARVSAMRAKLLDKSSYDKLLKMRVAEIAKFLQDYEYKEQINKLGVTLSGTQLIEAALQENHVHTLNKLKKISQGCLKTIIEEYLKKEDNWNIKTIIRGKFTKTLNDEIRKLLIPVGEFGTEKLNKLLALDSIDKVMDESKLSKHHEIGVALKTFKEKKALEILEAAIDKVYYKKLVKFIETLPSDARIIRDFLAGEIDSVNIRIILKFKREKIGDDVIKSLMFISRASKIPRQKWEEIISSKTVEGVAKEFEGTPYKNIVKKGVESLNRTGTLSSIDMELQKHLLERSIKLTHQNPLSVDVILAYMFTKQVEIKNLHLIAKSKQLGLSEEFMQRELIV